METATENQTDQIEQTEQAQQTKDKKEPKEKRPRYFVCASGDILETVRADSKEQAISEFNTKHGINPSNILDGDGAGFYIVKNYAKPVEEATSDFVKAKDLKNMDDFQTSADVTLEYKGHRMKTFEMIQKLENTVNKYYFVCKTPEKIDPNAPNFDFKGPTYLRENPSIKIEKRIALSF